MRYIEQGRQRWEEGGESDLESLGAVPLSSFTTMQPLLTPGEFWTRYFASKLFDRHRASTRNSVADRDELFDKYLGVEDDGEITIESSVNFSYVSMKA